MNNTIVLNSPNTREQFWSAKPADVSAWAWLFHPANPYRLPEWTGNFIKKVDWGSQLNGWTFFYQSKIAKWYDITEQWVRKIIQRLIDIGVIEDQKIGKNRQYRIVKGVFNTTSTVIRPNESFGESFGEKSKKIRATSTTAVSSGDAPKSHDLYRDPCNKDPITIINAREKDDGSLNPIVKEFQEQTGKPYVEKRDGFALRKLQQFPALVAQAAILHSALYAACKQIKIQSLAYVVPVAEQIANYKLDKETLIIAIKTRKQRIAKMRGSPPNVST